MVLLAIATVFRINLLINIDLLSNEWNPYGGGQVLREHGHTIYLPPLLSTS
jgi:hypothetical protein